MKKYVKLLMGVIGACVMLTLGRQCVFAEHWEKVEDKWCYLQESQEPVTGWKNLDGRWFYFYEDGTMAKSTWIGASYVGAGGAREANTVVDGKDIGADGKTQDLFLGDAKFIAHRGLSSNQPENTRDAFQWAGLNGFWGVECDVWITADGQYAILHDQSLQRVFGVNENVTDITMAEAQAHRLAEGGIETFSDVTMLSLDEYLSIVEDFPSLHPVIELKMDCTQEQLTEIMGMVEAHGLTKRAYVISFLKENLELLRSLYPDLSIQLLTGAMDDANLEWCIANNANISAIDGALTPETVKKYKDKGIHVAAWTIDDKSRALELIYDYGVEYVTTNTRLFE